MAPQSFIALAIGAVIVLSCALLLTSGDPEQPLDQASNPESLANVATESEVTVPDETPPGYYPPAESTAVGMTPAWRKFADSVDRICGLSYNYTLRREAGLRARAEQGGWSDPRWEAARLRLWGSQGWLILKATAKLGKPPAEPGLFRRWRANVARRIEVRDAAAEIVETGNYQRADSTFAQLNRLKNESDRIGQRFGLRICTSN